MTALRDRRCGPSVGIARLDDTQVAAHLAQLDGWVLAQGAIEKTFRFSDHHRTMAFVNALAWISHTQDHHPELGVTYAGCRVRYDTHTVHGLSINDFICAAKADAMVAATTEPRPAT
ncbi:MAG: 4a-hydroxytetrahydrobiopterin dehydratase [Burkholderiaceae bacterium]